MYSNTAARASSRVRKQSWWTCSVLSEAKKLSMGALSRQFPRRLMDCVMPCRSSTARYGSGAYRAPRSPWWTSPPARRVVPLDGHDQGVDAQPGPEAVGHGPADDLARARLGRPGRQLLAAPGAQLPRAQAQL